MPKKDKPRRNYLLLGASFLIVGLLVEFISRKIVDYPINIVYKTLIVMLMIVIGYSFAESVIAKFARNSLKALQSPFIKLAGTTAGKALFYIFVYAILFALYLLVFIYGLDIGSIPRTAEVELSSIMA